MPNWGECNRCKLLVARGVAVLRVPLRSLTQQRGKVCRVGFIWKIPASLAKVTLIPFCADSVHMRPHFKIRPEQGGCMRHQDAGAELLAGITASSAATPGRRQHQNA